MAEVFFEENPSFGRLYASFSAVDGAFELLRQDEWYRGVRDFFDIQSNGKHDGKIGVEIKQ